MKIINYWENHIFIGDFKYWAITLKKEGNIFGWK